MFSWFRNIIKEHKELKYLAYHDALTGLLNRNWLYKNINSLDYKYVYFIDINNLHEINKKGHTFGDEHIKKVVRSIKVTKCDILIRYAGDEFILFSNNDDVIDSNKLFMVGISVVKGNIIDAINEADKKMLIEKQHFNSLNV